MEIPTLNIGESNNSFVDRLNNYHYFLKQEKYNVLLNFINEWLLTNFKSLSEFKKISSTTLLKDDKHNNKMLKTYSKKLSEMFKLKISVDEDTLSDEIQNNYIIFILTKLLKNIGYSLISRKISDNLYYSITIIR